MSGAQERFWYLMAVKRGKVIKVKHIGGSAKMLDMARPPAKIDPQTTLKAVKMIKADETAFPITCLAVNYARAEIVGGNNGYCSVQLADSDETHDLLLELSRTKPDSPANIVAVSTKKVSSSTTGEIQQSEKEGAQQIHMVYLYANCVASGGGVNEGFVTFECAAMGHDSAASESDSYWEVFAGKGRTAIAGSLEEAFGEVTPKPCGFLGEWAKALKTA